MTIAWRSSKTKQHNRGGQKGRQINNRGRGGPPINKTERSELNRDTRNRRLGSFTEGRGESRGEGKGGRRTGDPSGERHVLRGEGQESVAARRGVTCNVSDKGKRERRALYIMKILKYFWKRNKNDGI